MMELILQTIIILTAATLSNTCSTQCSCSNGGLTVDCSNRKLTDIPDDIPTNVTILNLSHNSISSLNDAAFSTLIHLQNLDISFNIIDNISSTTFNGSGSLQKLRLSDNKIGLLHVNTFKPLTELNDLYLGNNSLQELPSGIFSECTKLFNIFLQNNKFDEIIFETLQQVFWAIHIDLSGNMLTYLPYSMLYGSGYIQILELTSNNIDYIDVNSFLGLKSLQFLYMSYNNIRTLKREMFHPLGVILEINLSHNDLICDCDTRKFQQWLIDESGGASLTDPVTCYDSQTNTQIDIANGDLTHLCENRAQTTSPAPTTCNPGQAICSEHANIWLESEERDGSVSFILKYQGISDDAFVKLDCGEVGENPTISVNTRINETFVLLTSLKPGTWYGCCAMVLLCDLYTCTHVATLGTNPDCHNVAYIASLSLAVMLLIIAIVIIAILICSIRYSSAKPVISLPGVTQGHEKSVLHDSLNSNVTNLTGFTSVSMISMDNNPTNGTGLTPMKGRPLPHPSSVKYRPESTYEHITFEAMDKDSNGGFLNKAFTGGANKLAINNTGVQAGLLQNPSIANGPANMTSMYITPQASPAGSPIPKKTRRFVRPTNVELTTNNRTRFDTMPALNNPKIVNKPERILSLTEGQISYDSEYDESERSPINKHSTIPGGCPPPGMILPPKQKKVSLAEMSYMGNNDQKRHSSGKEKFNRNSGEVSPKEYQLIKDNSLV